MFQSRKRGRRYVENLSQLCTLRVRVWGAWGALTRAECLNEGGRERWKLKRN